VKIVPNLHRRPVRLRLKDGKLLEIEDFWSLFIFDEIFLQHDYEPPLVMQRRGVNTIIDVGANIGLFVLRAKQIWPDARILAFEPDPANFAGLQRHIALNRLENVAAYNEGLSDRCGSCELFLSPRNIGGHSMYRRSDRSVRIQTRTLADALTLISDNGSCDLLKIDCEGCEYAILAGLTPDVAGRIKCIVIEPERDLNDIGDLIGALKSHDFAVRDDSHFVIATR
jgi:FkbM family methyltransferase